MSTTAEQKIIDLTKDAQDFGGGKGMYLGWGNGRGDGWTGLFIAHSWEQGKPGVTRGHFVFPVSGDFEFKGSPDTMKAAIEKWEGWRGFVKAEQDSGRLTIWRD